MARFDPTHECLVYARVKPPKKPDPKYKPLSKLGIKFQGFVRDGYEVYFVSIDTPINMRRGTLAIMRRHGSKLYDLIFRPQPFTGSVYCDLQFKTAVGAYQFGVLYYWNL